MEVSDARRLKVLEEENSKLKKLLADAMLDNAMLRMWPQENGDAAARREAAAHLHQVYRMSQRRACQAIGADRSSVRYRCRRPDDGPLRSRLREIAAVRRRFGYRRLHILLQREGLTLNP
jgi:putative transposase